MEIDEIDYDDDFYTPRYNDDDILKLFPKLKTVTVRNSEDDDIMDICYKIINLYSNKIEGIRFPNTVGYSNITQLK